jgi:glycosyltransferase involved in cell wall biosynthesis
VKGRWRTLLRSKNRQVVPVGSAVFAPGGVRRVICNSHFVADQIVNGSSFRARIDVIYNGVPYQQFSMGDRALGRRALGLNPDDYVVLLVGAGAERKGHAIARDAMRRFKKRTRAPSLSSSIRRRRSRCRMSTPRRMSFFCPRFTIPLPT